MSDPGPVVTVFADVACPFTHVGLHRFVRRRGDRGREDVALHVRAWPLEIVNGRPLSPSFVAEEIVDIRSQVAPDLFEGFEESAFPSTSIPALALAAAAYRLDVSTGESVSLELRDLLFERGSDIGDAGVLADLAARHGVEVTEADEASVRSDYESGRALGVVGSPYFLTDAGGFFCPALDVGRDDTGHLRITADPQGFEAFLDTCFD